MILAGVFKSNQKTKQKNTDMLKACRYF